MTELAKSRPWRRDVIARMIFEAVDDGETERARICEHVRTRFCPADAPVEEHEIEEAAAYLVGMIEAERGKVCG